MAEWIENEGGLEKLNARALVRASQLYTVIAELPDTYVSHVAEGSRSRVNVVFRLRDEALTSVFVKEAAAAGFINLAGHRSVGGIRASMYNAMPIEGAVKLADFMRDFAVRHPARTKIVVPA